MGSLVVVYGPEKRTTAGTAFKMGSRPSLDDKDEEAVRRTAEWVADQDMRG